MNRTQRRRRRASAFTLLELMLVVAIVGMLAIVAIPAFVRYTRIAKTAEAYRMISKIVNGVQTYYETPHFDSDGKRLPCMLAQGGVDPVTPPLGSCCSDGEPDGKCEPNETLWDTDAWKAKLFKISDKHYYSYSSGHQGSDQLAATTGQTSARGDLDCDGTYSYFAQIVTISRSSDMLHNCVSRKLGSMMVFNETE